MVDGYINAKIISLDEDGVGVETNMENMSVHEMLAAIGTLAADIVSWSDGKLDIENVVAAVRGCYYNNL